MTRFMISLEQGVELVWHAFDDMVGGEIYVKKISSMKVTTIADVTRPGARQTIVGIRPGEKLHEQRIGIEDGPVTFEHRDHYKILPNINSWSESQERIKDGKPAPEGFVYSSDTNSDWMAASELVAWIDTNREKIGRI